MKKFLTVLLIVACVSAFAEYKMIVPQKQDGGAATWAQVVARELEKKLGEPVILEYIPGANDVPGFNKWHNELRFNNKTIMVGNGGPAEQFLIGHVDFDYKYYSPIGLQNLSITVGHKTNTDPYQHVQFGFVSGTNPDIMAITLLVCGPKNTLAEYKTCYNEKIKYVKGFTNNERRLAYLRGELNVTRETPAAYIKVYSSMTDNVDWFAHGVMDLKSGNVIPDANFPGISFKQVYLKKWKVEPTGELYNAYLLVKGYRDVLQKTLWVNKGNPNTEKLRNALRAVVADPVSRAAIEQDTGKYEWIIGDDVNTAMKQLNKITTKKALKDLVWWSNQVLGITATYKDDIAH